MRQTHHWAANVFVVAIVLHLFRVFFTAVGMAVASVVALVLIAGAADRIFLQVGLSYTDQLWIYRAALVLVPVAVLLLAHRICRELREHELRPALGEEEAPPA